MKKLLPIVLALALTCAVAFAAEGTITVMSREDGSGTRSAFIELTGVEQDDVDMTTVDAVITNSTRRHAHLRGRRPQRHRLRLHGLPE